MLLQRDWIEIPGINNICHVGYPGRQDGKAKSKSQQKTSKEKSKYILHTTEKFFQLQQFFKCIELMNFSLIFYLSLAKLLLGATSPKPTVENVTTEK